MGLHQEKFREDFGLRGEALIIISIHTESPCLHQIYQKFNINPQMKSHLKRCYFKKKLVFTLKRAGKIL